MIIFVCVIIIFTISLLYISKKPQDTQKPEKTDQINTNIRLADPAKIEAMPTPVITAYTSPTYNFTLDFSESYKSSVLNTDNGARIDFTLDDWKAAMLVDKASNIDLIRNSYEIGQEDDVTINGLPATKIIGSSLKDSSVTYLYLITLDERLFVLYSTSSDIQSVAKTLSFSK